MIFRFRTKFRAHGDTATRTRAEGGTRALLVPHHPHAPASSAGRGAAAIAADWTGFGLLSGPFAIGALGSMLLAFVVATLPAATDEREIGDHVPPPSRSVETD
jgi:hypothetical protein